MEIIALSGYARSGKDEAARVLVEEHGFVRVAFADKLREMLYALNPIVAFKYDGPVYAQDVIDVYGWDGYKETEYGTEIRRLLQRLGTEAGRQTLWDSIWIDAALTGLPDDAKVVISDCRFANEAESVRKRGGKVWRITRPGMGPAVGTDGSIHPSETSLDNWNFDHHLLNNGTLEEYRNSIADVMRTYAKDAQN